MVFKDILRRRAIKSNAISLLKSTSPEYVIIAPLLTEKSYKDADKDKKTKKKYFFKVNVKATKIDIKMSIAKLYAVSVDKVNVLRVAWKWRANRKVVRKPYKKAIVTLKDGQSIDLF